MSEQRNVQRSACFACGQTFAPNEHHTCGGLPAQAGADNTTVEQLVVYDPRKVEVERLLTELEAARERTGQAIIRWEQAEQQAEDALEAQQALGLRLGQVERQRDEARAGAGALRAALETFEDWYTSGGHRPGEWEQGIAPQVSAALATSAGRDPSTGSGQALTERVRALEGILALGQEWRRAKQLWVSLLDSDDHRQRDDALRATHPAERAFFDALAALDSKEAGHAE